jgi:hypothetical protein
VKFAVNGVFLIEGNEPEVHKGIRYKTLSVTIEVYGAKRHKPFESLKI